MPRQNCVLPRTQIDRVWDPDNEAEGSDKGNTRTQFLSKLAEEIQTFCHSHRLPKVESPKRNSGTGRGGGLKAATSQREKQAWVGGDGVAFRYDGVSPDWQNWAPWLGNRNEFINLFPNRTCKLYSGICVWLLLDQSAVPNSRLHGALWLVCN